MTRNGSTCGGNAPTKDTDGEWWWVGRRPGPPPAHTSRRTGRREGFAAALVEAAPAFRGQAGGYRTGMDNTTRAGPGEEAVRAGQAKPATEQEEGLGEPDSSLPDDERDDDPGAPEDDRGDA
ncbi:hypothetical protein FHX81_1668 [Saccharothrix saharensis]|uniref:Uncharacterized protein n=1 Tax=Saccharothrix saharensis TaxID=571190 RepID=A0A543J994_9PSEU|nr:hypothetical protein [Saccharothrix saharensis]TQM79364.1 hypothetical protein FHX81_1668 [Saccharothrix saharensis]